MTHHCPVCQRTFDEPGFCPFDGHALSPTVGTAETPTVAEVSEPRPTLVGVDVHHIRAVSAAQQSTQEILDTFHRGSSDHDRLVGETLDGRYFIERKIGEGGMGVVYSARHAVLERPLAIKVLKREVMRDTATIKRFVQEARAASRIGHPNIVHVTDFGTTPDGMTYSVMEYVDGITLAKAIRSAAPMAHERAIGIALQIARALGAAHDKGIVHRDLKPENVFLSTRDGRVDVVKIVDFGIAKILPLDGIDPNAPKLTRVGAVFGTPEYMAPEQASGRGDIDGRVDVYALGTILYEMTCGRTPHKGNSLVRTIAMQMLDPITPLSQVSGASGELSVHPAFERVVMTALAKPREERYATMTELTNALAGVLVELERPTSTLSPAPPRRAKGETRPLHEPAFVATGRIALPQPTEEPPRPESRRLSIAVVSLLLLAGGAGAVWYASRSSSTSVVSSRDAAIVAIPVGDARLIAEPSDAEPVAPDGARAIVVASPEDGGFAVLPIPHPDTLEIEVLTRPAEANVFVGRTFRGPSGAKLREPWGTKLSVECRAPHVKGKVELVFDGSQTAAMCTAVRLPMCVAGLKNPYDECEP